MKKTSMILILGSVLASSSGYARSCQDEPERCPALKMTCSSQISAEKFLTASVYDSFFSGKIIRVSATICAERNCHTKSVAGKFDIYQSGSNYNLINKATGEIVAMQCSTVNGSDL